jgi:hypothetical protein
MINDPSPPEISGSGGTSTAQFPQLHLASCPVYDHVSWSRCNQSNEPLYDVACYIYAMNWPNAGLADIHEVGDIYAYKQPVLRANLLKKSKGYLDTLLEKNALPKQQLGQLLTRIKIGGWQALSLTEQQQIVGLGDWLEVLSTAEEYKEGSFPQQLATRIFQAYVRTIRQCASLDGLIEIDVSPQTTLASLPARQGCYLVALAFWFDPDGPDHHWYRLDNNGCWSHKPGQTQVRNADSSNQIIHDPRLANLRPYTFCCFYYVPVAILLQGIEEAVDEFDPSSGSEDDFDSNDQQSSSEEEHDNNDQQHKSTNKTSGALPLVHDTFLK